MGDHLLAGVMEDGYKGCVLHKALSVLYLWYESMTSRPYISRMPVSLVGVEGGGSRDTIACYLRLYRQSNLPVK